MTTYTRSVTASFGNTTITQNVNTTDTVEVTEVVEATASLLTAFG